jgi:hypothetical protein
MCKRILAALVLVLVLAGTSFAQTGNGNAPGIGGGTDVGTGSTILLANQPADFAFFFPGTPTASSIISFIVTRTYTLPASFLASGNAANSLCRATIAATDDTVFNLQRSGSNIATITFPAGMATCNFSAVGPFTFSPGQVLTVEAPASPDATLANISITVSGVRN